MSRWILGIGLVAAACTMASPPDAAAGAKEEAASVDDREAPAPVPKLKKGQDMIVFGGGCFWCVEADFDKLDGIVSTTSGYAGGTVDNPSYRQVGSHSTGHVEVVRVVWDTKTLSTEQVLDYFWHHVDPTDAGGQFCDRGDVYRTVIYAQNEAQLEAATASKKALASSGALRAPVVTEVKLEPTFWSAENYHQDFWKTNAAHYARYRAGCGRDARVREVWASAH